VRRALPALILCSLLAPAGCGGSSTSPSPTATVTTTDLRLGSGTAAASGQTITVNYTGWLYDSTKPDNKGVQFDSSLGRGPFQFTLGAGQVIPGWEMGIPGMKPGGLRRLVIPSSLAYGGVRYQSIPPYSTLLFDIELVAVQDSTTSQ
jgi:FKBP-type peptidyl-prolyl cis-trans isomerase